MKIKTLLLLLLLPGVFWAQKTNLTGMVTDSAGVGLPAASVVLMEQKDSIIASFGTSGPDGAFALRRITRGNYLLQVSYAGYEAHYQAFTIEGDRPVIDLGKIQLLPANVLLGGVDITADRAPMRISNDTITYNAGVFRTQPGSVVEDLLEKLPGVEVQSDGTIKAYGEVVRNVMVDGKEFFGNDPKIATKNLPADAVDKVQIFDKKSERAEFTGIADGQEEKTINLQLKDNAKAGYFGNAAAGYGTSDRYEGKFNVNKFTGRTQLSAIGNVNNINQEAFSFEDYIGFMGGLSNFLSGENNGGTIRFSLDDANSGGIPGMGQNLKNGFTTAWAGGLNLNHDFSKKTKISANYFYNRLARDLDEMRFRENLGGSTAFNSTDDMDQFSRNNGHRLNLTLKSKLDSAQNITLRSRWALNDAVFSENSAGVSYGNGGALQNSVLRNYASQGTGLRGDAVLTYKRKLNRRGRSLVADASFQKNDNERTGFLLADNTFNTDSGQLLVPARQRQLYNDDASNWGGSVSWTEPLGKKQYLEWRVSGRKYANNTDKLFYDTLFAATPQEIFNPQLSNRFKRGYAYQRGSMNYSINRETFNFTAGAVVQQSVLSGQLLDVENTPITRRFVRVLPSMYYHYEPKAGFNVDADYNTELREPSLEQLQPVVDNSNPLNTFTGNPDLKPEYVHAFNARLMRFDAFTNMALFLGANVEFTLDKITNAGTVDELLRTNVKPVNVKNDWRLAQYAEFSRPLRPLKVNLSVNLNSTFNRGILFINAAENNTRRWTNGLDVELDNRKKKYLDARIGARLSHNSVRYSVSDNLNQSYLNQRYFTELEWYPGKKWVLSTRFDYTIYSKETFGEAQQIPLWRASLTRYVLKNRKGQIKLSAFDLLNQNVGITRNTRFNYVEEVRTRNLSRYFMLTFAWSLSGFAAEKADIIEFRGPAN